MIVEDYVSFETAKMLKEKGFDAPCNCYGAYNGVNLTYRLRITDKYTNWNKHDDKLIISCPTLQMVMKWLREVHNLFIFPFPQMNTNKFWTEIFQLSDNQEWKNLYCESIDLQDYSTYEQACEAAIKYCLENLI